MEVMLLIYRFFTGNGYDIVDKKTFEPKEITFANIWGVCDEDMYHKAIKIMNQEAKTGQPFSTIL
jgi:phosphoglycerol transferase MdoB-like AlkP superfamily enzyme